MRSKGDEGEVVVQLSLYTFGQGFMTCWNVRVVWDWHVGF
jgi:hypothetical protein